MALDIEAIYENGALRPLSDLPLQDGQRVKITVHTPGSAVERLYGMLKWTGNPDDLDYLLGPDNRPCAGDK